MGISKHKTIFGIIWYELSNNYIYELRQKGVNQFKVFDILPKYTINTNEGANNQLIDASYFLQFVGHFIDGNVKNTYSFIDIVPFDSMLSNEISNTGLMELFENVDFKKVLTNIKPQTDDDFKAHQMPITNFFIGEIQYYWSKNFESGYDELDDIEFEVIGYLDAGMNSIFFENL